MKKFFCEKFVLSIGAAAVIAVAAVNVNFGKSVKLPELLLKNIEALANNEGPFGERCWEQVTRVWSESDCSDLLVHHCISGNSNYFCASGSEVYNYCTGTHTVDVVAMNCD